MLKKLDFQSDKYLSDIRLYRYKELEVEHGINFLDLYSLNLKVSQELFGMIAMYETLLRNKIHKELVPQNYLSRESGVLSDKAYEEIGRARRYVDYDDWVPSNTESRLITKLSLGFWTRLFTNNLLWTKKLYKVFKKDVRTANDISASKIIALTKQINKTRNMIAHQQRIIFKPKIDILQVCNSIELISLWLIDESDKEFRKYIEIEMKHRIKNIKQMLSQKVG